MLTLHVFVNQLLLFHNILNINDVIDVWVRGNTVKTNQHDALVTLVCNISGDLNS